MLEAAGQREVLQTVLVLEAQLLLGAQSAKQGTLYSGLMVPFVLNFTNNRTILTTQVFLQLLQSSCSNHG